MTLHQLTGDPLTVKAKDIYVCENPAVLRAVPWRMSASDHVAADGPLAETEALKGAAAPSPWDPELADLMTVRGWAVMEERMIPELLTDLHR